MNVHILGRDIGRLYNGLVKDNYLIEGTRTCCACMRVHMNAKTTRTVEFFGAEFAGMLSFVAWSGFVVFTIRTRRGSGTARLYATVDRWVWVSHLKGRRAWS